MAIIKATALEKSYYTEAEQVNHNFVALNSLGMYYISAPAIGGGDVGKGIATIQKALASIDEFDHFISNVWLGKAYQKKKSFAEAASYYKKHWKYT